MTAGPPLYVVTTEEMRQIEAQSNARGHTFDDMMRLAGAAVAQAVEEQTGGGVVVCLCGPGNNGGDALVAAGLLRAAGHDARVALWHREAGKALPEAEAQLAGAPSLAVEESSGMERLCGWLAEADAVVDGLLGTGLARPIEGPLAELLDAIRPLVTDRHGPLVVAVDVPTGLDSDTGALDPHAFPADLTVTFGFPKHGQLLFPGARAVGELVVDRIGLAADIFTGNTDLATAAGVAASLPDRPPDGHKGTFGRLLVAAGSISFTGAAYMAAVAAYRVGCGLVTAAVAESVRPILAGLLPEATFLVLPEDLGVISRAAAPLVLEVLPECDAMVLGPGLTTQPPAAEFVAALLAGQGPPHHGAIGFAAGPPDRDGSPAAPAGPDGLPARLVVDADGLNLLGRQGLARLPAGCVLTPHPGEMARLAGKSTREIQEDRLAAAREAASAWGHVVVLKGAFTVVASPDGRATIMPFANAALAKGGTGDVLTGAIGGLLAQGMEARDAAVAGAYVHGLAGELAAAAVGPRAVTASDVAERLGRAFAQIEAAD